MERNQNIKKNPSNDLDYYLNIWQNLLKHIRFIICVSFIFLIAGIIYSLSITPIYESQAVVRIRNHSNVVDPVMNERPNSQLMNTYQEILKSRTVVENAIKKSKQTDEDGSLTLYDDFENVIETQTLKDTEMFMVMVSAKDPQVAQRFNQNLIECFLERLTEMNRIQYSLARQFLEERMLDARQELNNAEDALSAFQKDHKTLSIENDLGAAADKFSLIDKMRAENQIKLDTALAKDDAISKNMGDGPAQIADSDEISAYNKAVIELETRRIEYVAKYTSKHPKMEEIDRDIAEVKGKLKHAIDKVLSGHTYSTNPTYNELLREKYLNNADISVAQSNLSFIDKMQKEYDENLINLSDNQKEYVKLLRDINIAQEIYNMLAQRLEEAKIAEVSISRDVQIIDDASLPTHPIDSGNLLKIAIAFLIGLLLSGGLVTARYLLFYTITTDEDVEKYLELHVLGKIPKTNGQAQKRKLVDFNEVKKNWRALWKR